MTSVAGLADRVGVVGSGLMGAGIAEVFARAGSAVLLYDQQPAALDAGLRRLDGSLERATRGGRIDAEQAAAARDRITVAHSLDDLADRSLVVEAVAESEAVKLRVFAEVDHVLADGRAVLVSNTSSIPIMKLAMATSRPDRVMGLHFFNPVPVMRLVELVPSMLTSPEVQAGVRSLVEQHLRKTVVNSPDRAGFVVNSLLIPYLLAAIRMYESGFASAEDIDRGMELGCAHPMGPLRLADFIGLDTVQAIAQAMYDELKEPLYSPSPLLRRMVEAGLLGAKTGRGFHHHDVAAR